MTKRRSRRSAGGGDGGFCAGPGTVVTLAYALLDAEGELAEEGGADDPLELLFGYGQAGAAIEQALGGASVGQERVVQLDPDEAFGERDPEAILSVDPAELPPGIEPGAELSAEGAGGELVTLRVVEVMEDAVLLDANHPLSGQRVTLRLRVLGVRPARPEEIEHAVDRLTAEAPAPQPLLPAERLLRRRRAEPRNGEAEPVVQAGENPVEKA